MEIQSSSALTSVLPASVSGGVDGLAVLMLAKQARIERLESEIDDRTRALESLVRERGVYLSLTQKLGDLPNVLVACHGDDGLASTKAVAAHRTLTESENAALGSLTIDERGVAHLERLNLREPRPANYQELLALAGDRAAKLETRIDDLKADLRAMTESLRSEMGSLERQLRTKGELQRDLAGASAG